MKKAAIVEYTVFAMIIGLLFLEVVSRLGAAAAPPPCYEVDENLYKSRRLNRSESAVIDEEEFARAIASFDKFNSLCKKDFKLVEKLVHNKSNLSELIGKQSFADRMRLGFITLYASNFAKIDGTTSHFANAILQSSGQVWVVLRYTINLRLIIVYPLVFFFLSRALSSKKAQAR